ncbi:MAG: TonB-dependent receptor [Chitinophagaceae bacterium]|nr:TonB-dependent receptor [Chitinophagaceae bacterium]
MKRIATYAVIMLMVLPALLSAQGQVITGTVKNALSKEAASAVSVGIKGTNAGTFTDENGNFRLPVPASAKFPVTVVFTSIGYGMKEVQVNAAGAMEAISLSPSTSLGDEVVVSAERETVDPNTINYKISGAMHYKITNSLEAIVAGFWGSGNLRFNQIVDGMDNQAPGLNFSVGSIVGLTELDVDNMELLQGASSALYGPGGMNGTLLINSKSPFKYQGLSFQVKEGLMHTDKRYRNTAGFHNWNVRYAKKIGDKFAFKINTELIQAKDWLAADYRNVNRTNRITDNLIPGDRATDPNYDGVNTYGDETTIERETVDPNTINYKISGAMHYKITNSLEAIVAGFWGSGNTVYTGSERYSLRDLKMGQYKVELNHRNWNLRAYTTQENSGQSYNSTVTARLFNEGWKNSTQWYTEYGQAYLAAKLNGLNDANAHAAARNVADVGRPAAGSDRFNRIFDSVRTRPISKGGGLFVDRSDLYAVEGQYNLSHLTGDFAEIVVGGNFRRFTLNSQGTLFADSTSPISINEYGAYIQATKPFLDEKLKITLSGRYDKNQNFKGRFTPRATALVKLAQNHNLRISYQQAYRFPSTQNQFINLGVGGAILIGGVPAMLDYYKVTSNPTYSLASLLAPTPQLKVQTYNEFKPESVTSYEVGYRGLMADKKLLIDAYGYFGQYKDFITSVNVVQSIAAAPQPTDVLNPARRRILQVPVNSTSKVSTMGAGVSFEYSLKGGYYTNVNGSWDKLGEVTGGDQTNFNAPNYRYNMTFGNNGFLKDKRTAFSVVYRWQDAFFYTSTLANGTVPAYHTLDAQVSYRFPEIKSAIRFGANNILNQYYITAIANPSIGGMYYVSFGYNIY